MQITSLKCDLLMKDRNKNRMVFTLTKRVCHISDMQFISPVIQIRHTKANNTKFLSLLGSFFLL